MAAWELVGTTACPGESEIALFSDITMSWSWERSSAWLQGREKKKSPEKKKLHWFEVKSICSPKMPWDWLSLAARCGGEQSRTNLADRGTLRWFVITRLRNKGVELMEAGLETCNLKIPCDSNKFLLLAEFFTCLLIPCCIHSSTCYIKLILKSSWKEKWASPQKKPLTDVKLQCVD